MPRLTVVGSLNTDLVIRSPRLPEVGETVTGGEFATFPGGKGANQAVAAARLGAKVTMVGCVGGDDFGRQLVEGLLKEGIDTTHVRKDAGSASGTALITVDPGGRNTIVVAPGANWKVTVDDVQRAEPAIAAAAVLLLQLEIPIEPVLQAARLARKHGVRVILDPAPAPRQPLPDELDELVDVINPNEVEARALTGVVVDDERNAREAAALLRRSGVRATVIKLGPRGALVDDGERVEALPGIPVEAVDTTAAGDAFAGALAVALAEDKDLAAAARFANVAGAISVTRRGAQPSMPSRGEVIEFARQRNLPA